ncbi:MAG: barstar family protein [Oscillospiraceae bacterium]|nr:barstar family protein [Oscillospiraceae bacterium]
MAEIETIILDGERMRNRRAAHDHLAEQLGLPEYYGRNLDALYDLLTERGCPTRLVVQHKATLISQLGKYGIALCRTLEDADQANPSLEVLFPEDRYNDEGGH